MITRIAVLVSTIALASGGSPLRVSSMATSDLQTVVAAPKDFYYYRATPVHLRRSVAECVVALTPRATEGVQQLLSRLSPSASLAGSVRSEGREFHIVTVQPVADGAAIESLMARLRLEEAVEFVAPVFHELTAQSRLVPTDEIVVKLRTGITPVELASLSNASRVTIHRSMPSTSDEYVLRLTQPKVDDALERSRALYETGRFQWAEPNFVRQFQRRA